MKNMLLCILAIVVLAVVVFWILPAALNFLMGAALLAAFAAAAYFLLLPYWRKNEAQREKGEQARSDRKAEHAAQKSLKAMERDLRARDKMPH